MQFPFRLTKVQPASQLPTSRGAGRNPSRPRPTVRPTLAELERRLVPASGVPVGNACDTFGPAAQLLVDTLPLHPDLPDLGWVWVDPANRFQSASGTVVDSGVTHTDFPLTHDSHDQNATIALDVANHPEYANLTSPANAPGQLEFEWEIGARPDEHSGDGANPIFPKWAWPSTGDQVWINGDWIYDCGHPVDGLFHTEIHPPRAIASMRDQVAVLPGPVTTPVRVTSTDLYIHGDGGYASDVLADHDIIVNGGSRTHFTPIDDFYTFDIPLPPKPSPDAVLASPTIMPGPGNTVSSLFDPVLVPFPDQGKVTAFVNLTNSGALPTDVYARVINVGWQVPPADLHHVSVTLQQMHLTQQSDGTGDDELTFFWLNVNRAAGEWVRLADFANGNMDDFGAGQTMTFSGATFDFYVADGQTVSLHAEGYDQDSLDDVFGQHGPLAAELPVLVAAFIPPNNGDNDAYNPADVTLSTPDFYMPDLVMVSGNIPDDDGVYQLQFAVQLLDPVLATLQANGVLRLNLGPYAADRLHENTTDGDEQFHVDHVTAGLDGTETVTVSAFGFTQQYSGVRSIYAEGGEGNDSIALDPGVNSPAELWGDFNPAFNAGGFGNDVLRGGAGDDVLHGGGGNDQLFAAGGNDVLNGDDGADILTAGIGTSQLLGGADADTVVWKFGDGPIFVNGGTGTDRVNLFGSPQSDAFVLSAVGPVVQVQAPGFNMNPVLVLGGVERIDVEGLQGADQVTVNSLDGTGVHEVDVDLFDLTVPDFTTDAVVVNGTARPEAFHIKATQILIGRDQLGGVTDVSRGDFLVRVANVQDNLLVRGRAGGDTFNIQSLTGPTTVDGDNGPETFKVFAQQPNDYLGPLTLDGGTAKSTLTVDESASPLGTTTNLTSALVTGTLFPFGVAYVGAGGFGGGVTLLTGVDPDVVNVQDTLAGAATTINTGPGDDLVFVCSNAPSALGDLAGIRDTLSIDLGAGVNNFLELSD